MPCLLLNGKSLPPPDRDPQGQSVTGHAATKRHLYPSLQPPPRACGACTTRAIQGHTRRQGQLPARIVPVYRAQPGTCQHGQITQKLSLVQLSWYRGIIAPPGNKWGHILYLDIMRKPQGQTTLSMSIKRQW